MFSKIAQMKSNIKIIINGVNTFPEELYLSSFYKHIRGIKKILKLCKKLKDTYNT